MTLQEINDELHRQAELRAAGKFTHTAGNYAEEGRFHEALTVLTEEVGEVARALNDGSGNGHLRKELIQVAAVAVSFIQGIDMATATLLK